MKIEFDVTYQNIERSDRNHVVADSKNYLQAEFNFQTAEWIGKTKTAIFARLGLIKNVILESDDTCMVPWEMLKTGSFTVSVFAGDLITANYVKVPVAESGYQLGETPHPPTPDVYTQIITMIENLQAGEVSEEQIKKAVDEYLTENPVEGLSEEDVQNIISEYLTENPVGVDEEEVKTIVDEYLTENPVESVTDEQIAEAVEEYLTEHPASSADFVPVVEFHLEEKYQCHVGKTLDIYFDNIVTANCSMDDIYFAVSGDSLTYGSMTMYDDRIKLLAVEKDVGTKKLTITARYSPTGVVAGTASVSFNIMSASTLSNSVKMMFIGDSLTDQNTFPKRVKTVLGDNLTLYGTRGTDPYFHEGRTSWTTKNYLQSDSYNTFDNPFYNADKEGTNKFDFAYYITNHQEYKDIQIVNIFLGRNDGYTLNAVENLRIMIDSILEYNNEIIITLFMSYHLGYAVKRTKANKDTVFNFNTALHEEFDNDMNVVLIPAFVAIDGFYDHPHSAQAVSSVNTETKSTVTDKVHLNTYGYYKIADVLVAYLKNIFATRTLTTKYVVEVVDKSALLTAIESANTSLESVQISDDGTDISTLDTWVTQSVYDEYESAIAMAQTEYDSEESTDESIESAIIALETATATFDSAKAAGTMYTVDKSTLLTAIESANTNLSSVQISEDGTDVLTTDTWVTQTAYDEYSTAISTAQTEYDSEESTEESVFGAVTALESATTTFESQKAAGTYVEEVSYVFTNGTYTCDISTIAGDLSILSGKYVDVFYDSTNSQYVAFVTNNGFGHVSQNSVYTYLRYDKSQSLYIAGYYKTSTDGITWDGYTTVKNVTQTQYNGLLTRIGEQRQY